MLIYQACLIRPGAGFGLQRVYRWNVAPDPGVLARDLWVEVSGTLPAPLLGTDPPQGVHSILAIPAFVQVENWTGVLTPSACNGPLCATVTLTPALTWDPGDGSPVVDCDGNGTRYDRFRGGLFEQARRAGACTHTYFEASGEHRDRPEAWPGIVSVTWTITWTATNGEGGTLPPVTRSTPLPRAVDEIEAVIVDVD